MLSDDSCTQIKMAIVKTSTISNK